MSEDRSYLKNISLLGIITADLLGLTGAGLGLGYYLWNKHGWPWWIVLLTTAAGLVLAILQLYRLSKREFGS